MAGAGSIPLHVRRAASEAAMAGVGSISSHWRLPHCMCVSQEAREKHVAAALEDMIVLGVRPCRKAEFTNLFRASTLIQNRHKVVADGIAARSQDNDDAPERTWRHAWLYDAGADREP